MFFSREMKAWLHQFTSFRMLKLNWMWKKTVTNSLWMIVKYSWKFRWLWLVWKALMCKRLWSQADSGMAGLILIEDPADCSVPRHIRRVSCPLHCEHDIQLIFQAQLAYHSFGFSQVQRIIKDNLFMYQLLSYFCLSFSSFLFFLLAIVTDSTLFGRIVRYVIGGCFWQRIFSYVNMDSC